MAKASEGWWPEHLAVAWVLTRDIDFVEACNREDPGFVVDVEADHWRRTGAPMMSFPNVEQARMHLRDAFQAIGPASYLRDEVCSRSWPSWQGVDPRNSERVPFSHAAWWIASEAGTRTITFDDSSTWQSAFSILLKHIVAREVGVYRTDPAPAELIDAQEFDGVEIDYPCNARHGFGGRAFEEGRDTFLACSFEPIGDQYFKAGDAKAKLQRLMVRSHDLLSICPPRRHGSKEFTPQDIEDYKRYADAKMKLEQCWPTRKEDMAWGKQRGLSRDLMRKLRGRYRGGPEFNGARKGGAPKKTRRKKIEPPSSA